ncbi:MAG: hypothetical protein FJ026_09105, partial [Chloroflexi bacterium]|nr:hypothetical protein [Chloroflexota bacterium]
MGYLHRQTASKNLSCAPVGDIIASKGAETMNQGPEGDVRSASTALGDQVLSDKLHNALAAHLYREARRLGLPFSGARVATICQSLLREPVEDSSCAELSFPAHAVRESTLFNTYYTENLELHDYLHMVSQDMRKRLGQYVTPSVIVKYILDAVEYREDLDILDKRLTDPACGSGIFLLEAIRIYL